MSKNTKAQHAPEPNKGTSETQAASATQPPASEQDAKGGETKEDETTNAETVTAKPNEAEKSNVVVAESKETKESAAATASSVKSKVEPDEVVAKRLRAQHNVKEVFKVGAYWFTRSDYAEAHAVKTKAPVKPFKE